MKTKRKNIVRVKAEYKEFAPMSELVINSWIIKFYFAGNLIWRKVETPGYYCVTEIINGEPIFYKA